MFREALPFLAAVLALLPIPPPDLLAQSSTTGTPPPQHQHQHGSAHELFANRDASGTAWLPEQSPMFAAHRTWRGWDLMFHGVAFAQFLYEPADQHRTGGFESHQFGSVNWGMVHARRPVGPGIVGLRAMGSLEPFTISNCGYLNFLASGEHCEGDTIHDRQHPHDLFMEIAAEYDRPLRGAWRLQLYGGLAGEPALGPAGFPHRISSFLNPIAPISHHWLDSTHVTFGLVTAGVYDRRWKLEASVFNGREPDENRTDLDLAPLDSVAGRISFLPDERVALQFSAAHLHEAEAEFAPRPRSDVDRATASVTYHRPIGRGGVWASTLAYGVNSAVESVPGETFDAATHAVMLESSAIVNDRHTWFGRAEVVGKPAHDLHVHEFPTAVFTVGKVQVGYIRHWRSWRGLLPGIGGTLSLNFVPAELATRYEGRVAPGFGVFFSVRAVENRGSAPTYPQKAVIDSPPVPRS
jgi:hypothetical protein